MIELAGQFGFGSAGTARPFLGEGWSDLEPDFSWTVGNQSTIRLPLGSEPKRLVVELNLTPRTMPPVLRRQRLIIWVNGVRVGEETIGAETPIAFEIPAAALAGKRELDVILQCPDAVTPQELGMSGDTRLLGFAMREIMLFTLPERPPFAPRVRPKLPGVAGGIAEAVHGLTGLSVPEVAGHFESLGHNCEFGLAQRKMGLETLGLLRFGGISPHRLAEGLDLDFEGMEAIDNLTTYVNEPGIEFIVRDRLYGTNFHTHLTTEETTAEAVRTMFSRNLTLLRRKFMEDIRDGGKIFVFQHPESRSVAHVLPFLNLLRSHGPNTLLFITEGGEHLAGGVEQLEPDLLHGYVDTFAPLIDVLRLDATPWIHVCANAYRMWRETASLRLGNV